MKLLTYLLFLSSFAQGQTYRDSIVERKVTVPTSHDTTITYQTFHDSTYTVYDTIKIYIDTLFKGIYVNGWSSVIGNKVKEDALIASLNFYRLNHISIYSISSNTGATNTALLFKRIRSETGVKTICPAISSSNGINNWVAWNNSHVTAEDVDGVTFEYEAYNQTDVAAAWKTNVAMIQQADGSVKAKIFIMFNEYFGWWTKVPMIAETPDTLAKYFGATSVKVTLNKLFLHDYRTTPDPGYMYSRLATLNASGIERGVIVPVNILFSYEPDFLQNWLKNNHTVEEAFWIVYNGIKSKGYTNIKVTGYMGFHLDFLRASSPVSAPMMMAKGAKPQEKIYSEKRFKNKTTRKSKRMAKYLGD